MALTKITDSDLAGKGVAGQADTPGLTAAEMQAKVEELSRAVVIPKFNALSAELDTDLAQRPTNAGMQAYVDAKVIAAGAGDMLQSVYDPAGYARQLLPADGDAGNASASFSAAEADADIASGEKLSVLFGKIKKRFAVWAARLADVGAPNLLDNSLWRTNGDIVNQRGKTAYADSSGVAMDRWAYTRCTVSLAARTVSVAPGAESDGYLYQRTDKAAVGDALTFTVRIAGQDFTASTVLAEGSALTAPLLCAAPWGGLKLYSASGVCTAMLYLTKGQSIPFPEWLKLERGAVATPYVPRGFAAELSECMRYYQTIGFWLRCWADATGANCTLPLGLPMRAVPAASVSTGYTNNMASVNTAVGATSVAVLLVPTATGMVQANGSVTLSADL